MLNNPPDPPHMSGRRLEALRERLRAGMTREAIEQDRSWRFQIAKPFARVPVSGLAAAVLVAAGVVSYGAWRGIEPFTAGVVTQPVEAGALPIRALTPGATARVTADDLCAGRRPLKEPIAPSVRQAVLHDYRMDGIADEEYELDYLITPELGGSSDRRNLWPERYGPRVWNARVKDELEGLLPALVCRGAIDLVTAQQDIAADWIAAYKKYFHTDRPVSRQGARQRHVGEFTHWLPAPTTITQNADIRSLGELLGDVIRVHDGDALFRRIECIRATSVDQYRGVAGVASVDRGLDVLCLLEKNPVLDASIRLRLPYLEPRNLLQVELLKRHRAGENDARVREGIQLSINAVATALRNSG